MTNIRAIPIFNDNYVWIIDNAQDALIVDPGDAAPVIEFIKKHKLNLKGVLLTHHHSDHIGGVREIVQHLPAAVYGYQGDVSRIPEISHPLDDGDTIETSLGAISVWHVPGHTTGHIAYLSDNAVFCGDTLFSGGCGRMFEGTAAQFHQSLHRLQELPEPTLLCCTHEYTQANLRFATHVEPDNQALQQYQRNVNRLRDHSRPTLPSTIGLERQINPFLRIDSQQIRQACESFMGQPLHDRISTFAALRRWKDNFRG